MLIALTNLTPDARELGFLLHKHPQRVHKAALAFGSARVFYPEATEERCTAVLLIEVDPIALVRTKGSHQGDWALRQYVNDRPYVASSFLSVAISRVLGTALNGRCERRPELIDRALEMEIEVPVVSAPGSEEQIVRLFAPLGYEVRTQSIPLDQRFPEWGESRYQSVILRVCRPLHEILKHLFVLLPTLDRLKHYWVGSDEVEKLLAKGEGWLASHPEKDWISTRYLKYRRALTREALARLVPDQVEAEEDSPQEEPTPEVSELRVSLHDARLDAVTELLIAENPSSVLDLGCGEGRLLVRLLRKTRIPRITGMDVDSRVLRIAEERLERLTLRTSMGKRFTLLQSSLLYRDRRLEGHDAAVLVEVIEHLEPQRLAVLERTLFEHLAPRLIAITTPNRDYNVLFENMSEGAMRHRDHRFEWTRSEFADWANRVAESACYEVELSGLGESHPEFGTPSQMAVFRRKSSGDIEKKEADHGA